MTKQKFGPTALWRLKVNGLALTALAGMGLGGSYKGLATEVRENI